MNTEVLPAIPRSIPRSEAEPRWRYASRESLLIVLALGLFTVANLPILPLWGDLLRILAIGVVAAHPRMPRTLGTALAVLLFALLLWPIEQAHQALFTTPFRYVADAVRYVAGPPLEAAPGTVLLLINATLFAILGTLCWRDTLTRATRIPLVALLVLGAFLTAGGLAGLANSNVADSRNTLASASTWLSFLIGAFLTLLLARTDKDRRVLLTAIGIAAAFQAILALSQMALADWSYILEFPEGREYIQRVRGTYYYHGSLDLFLTIGMFVMVALTGMTRRPWLPTVGFVLAATVMSLNSTRALSLGICAGTMAALICLWRNRAPVYRPLVLALLIAVPVFASQVLYNKAENKAAVAKETTVEVMAQTNTARVTIFDSALSAIEAKPWLGHGPSCAIPLSGQVLGGERCTDSSHALLLDLAVMSGVPAALMFLLFVASITVTLLWMLLVRRDADPGLAGIVGLIAMLSVASFFFPKERDWNILIIFVVLAVTCGSFAGRSASVSLAPSLQNKRLAAAGFAVSALATLIWAFVASPAYTLPLIDFMRARSALGAQAQPQTIYSNSRGLAIFGKLVSSLGSHAPKALQGLTFEVLPDDVERAKALPPDTWVFWTGASDKNYPNFLEHQGFNYHRHYGVAPSPVLPRGWENIRSSSPSFSLIRVGSSSLLIPVGIGSGLCTAAQQKGPQGAACTLRVKFDDQTEVVTSLRMSTAARGVEAMAVVPVGNNLARPDTIKVVRPRSESNAPSVGDGQAATSWSGNDGDGLVIDARWNNRKLPYIYAIEPANYDDGIHPPPRSWTLEGSNDRENWTQLDARDGEPGAHAGAPATWFSLTGMTTGYDYYRFTLKAQEPGGAISLANIRLYTQFPGTSQHE